MVRVKLGLEMIRGIQHLDFGCSINLTLVSGFLFIFNGINMIYLYK